MINHVLFDCSDTLLRLHAKADLAEQLQSPERAEHIHNTFFKHEKWGGYDNGLFSDEEMKAAILPLFDEEDRPIAAAYFDGFTDHYTPIDGIPELLAELKEKGYGLYIVSDFPPRFVQLWERYGFFRLFDGRAVSFEAKGSKKDLRLFEYVKNTYGLNPDECLFVDDLPQLVKNAEACGFHGHVFQGTEPLRADLKRRAIL